MSQYDDARMLDAAAAGAHIQACEPTDERPSPEDALRTLLDSIVECRCWEDLEGGQGGYGPVVQGYLSLGLSIPLPLADWIESDDEDGEPE